MDRRARLARRGPATQADARRTDCGGSTPPDQEVRVTQVDDETLTRELAEHLEAGFEAVVRAYEQRLYAFALRLTGSPRDAEEIAQDAFVRAYRAFVSYD